MAHGVFTAFLSLIILTAVGVIGIHGFAYYTTPISERPFLPEYKTMKPSGPFSHGLGIVGASLITIGVAMYSTRKRMKRLWHLGKLSRWLEVHIVLCLLGPILVVFHTTFKAGGIAAISLWCMVSVAMSGVIGRFLYVQIPRNIKGNELTEQEIGNELDRLSRELSSSPLGNQLVKMIDESFSNIPKPRELGETVATIFRLRSIRRRVNHTVREMIARAHDTREHTHHLKRLVSLRGTLMQRTIVLSQVEKLFYYWHVIHLPFTVIMFVALAAHVVVTVVLGYKWIF